MNFRFALMGLGIELGIIMRASLDSVGKRLVPREDSRPHSRKSRTVVQVHQ